MRKKKKNRKNQKSKTKKSAIRPWLFFLFAGMLVTSLVSLGLLKLYNLITESPRFRIKRIIINGGDKEEKRYVMRILRLKKENQNIILFDKDELEKKIEMNPDIRVVKIRKKFPDTLIIDIKKEIPFALILIGDDLFYLDLKGKIFRIKKRGESVDLPIITGLEPDDPDFNVRLQKAINVIHALVKKGINRISELHVTEYGSAHIYFTSPRVEVIFTHQIEYLDQNRITKKIKELKKVLNYFTNYAQIKITSIDLDCVKNGAVVRLGSVNG